MPFIEAAGITQHYELSGPADAPVLLFANSIGTSFHIWDAVVPRLRQRYRILRYDMRGHGLTQVTPVVGGAGYSMDLLAGDAAGLLDALGIARAHVCGLSIGGMMAQRLAVREPGRVQGLVLCDTAGLIGPPSVWTDRIAAIRARGMAAIADGVMARWFTAAFRDGRPDQIRGYTAMLARTAEDGYVGCAMAIRDADLRADAAAIAAPTLVICGEEDVATPPDLSRALAAAIPGARLALLPGAAHLPGVEKPAELAALIDGFLGGIPAEPR
ncbi:3-oxoadipate enol-lactonase [Azospirillum picis]|uniref:3-oxoadipate enol-lactonase n=1 Tax=Azospirillum picis TaxID=488438 RepID=A0ABU0MCX3_9PROT|nr:3-oxoadipate enol-lactonase [Azospirillum picis]MBP2297697.1 3-oxoadipate enol-lactonase [Azospirillum picis]MDQ0531280.1 3-oxoadipate enol-lactonase [Azospirillum picis]